MFVQGFGEVLTDVMTANPALADIPSASSILDASNFTFQAVTFGKDAEGFTQHAHVVSATQYMVQGNSSGVSAYDDGKLLIRNYIKPSVASGISAVSSYVISSTYLEFSSSYNSVPNDPSPLDVRLERRSTKSTNLLDFSGTSATSDEYSSIILPDLGHYANPVIVSSVDSSGIGLSSIWNKIGGFAPSGGADFIFLNRFGSEVYTGTLSSYFNTHLVMDKDGYLTISPSSVSELASVSFTDYELGSLVLSSTSYPVSSGKLLLKNYLYQGDAMTLAAFGSVKHIGVYCLDLKDMLSSGLTPPYDWNALNNKRKYKLVAKTTILDNPLHHRDGLGNPGFGHWLANNYVLLSLTFDFK